MKECCEDNLAPIYDISSGDYAIESALGIEGRDSQPEVREKR
jgi:hypothetical protein